MDSGLVRKAEKAKDYAFSRTASSSRGTMAEFRGDNGDHTISYEAGRWTAPANSLRAMGPVATRWLCR